jgi:hypothetical protein
MSFLKKSTAVSVQVKTDAQTAARLIEPIQTILTHLSPDDLVLLAKAVQNPLLKAQALAELKKYV